MSNFETFGVITGGLEGSAPARFIASTVDSYASLLAAGYMNDKAKIIKANDTVEINYSDASTFPLNVGESTIYASFRIQYDPVANNWNLIPVNPNTMLISTLGLHSGSFSNVGGSATTTITDSSINPNSIVTARWKSSANAVVVQTVTPGNGTLTIVSSGDPGASVIEYISILPSVALQNAGVIAATKSFAGGATTITILNPNITATSVVNANFVSQANASKVDKVTATAGTITILVSADPGVSVIAYVAVAPSSALTAAGLYAAQYTNAGGSATTTISDATITATSIVTADWSSSANSVQIEKVTATAGTLTILSSGDPGASVLSYQATPVPEGILAGTYLIASNNLSDVQSATTSATNLGLGTANNVAFLDVNAGNSGNAGFFTSFPATAARGTFQFKAANSAGNTATIFTNASMGQATTITVPDPGAAAADVVLSQSSLPTNAVVFTKVLTLTFTQLATAGKVNIAAHPSATSQFAVLDIKVLKSTGLSGGGGDRLLAVSDGTIVFNNAGITAALLGTPILTLWGGSGNPLAAGASEVSTAGADIFFQYTGGTTDYTAGSVQVAVTLVQVTA